MANRPSSYGIRELIEKLSSKDFLKHEFYQAWDNGSIPVEVLRTYAAQEPEYFPHAYGSQELWPHTQALAEFFEEIKLSFLQNQIEQDIAVYEIDQFWKVLENIQKTRKFLNQL